MFQTPQAINEVLVNRMFVQQKKIYTEKCKREPLHCLRCHGWGHMVRDCSASVDTCGTCAQRHRTDTCTNMAWPHCISCGRAGYASWARSCPMFSANAARSMSGWRTTSCHTSLWTRHGPKFESPPRSYMWCHHHLQQCTSLRGTEQHQCKPVGSMLERGRTECSCARAPHAVTGRWTTWPEPNGSPGQLSDVTHHQ